MSAGGEGGNPLHTSLAGGKTVVCYSFRKIKLAALRSLSQNARMGYAILRIAKRKTASSGKAMLTHALREVEVANAIRGAPKPEVISGCKTSQEALKQVAEGIALAKAQGGRQGFTKASTPVLDILVTTSHQDMQRLTKSQQDSYFQKALAFVASRFGGMTNILTAVVHRDEATPHMQVLLMPLDRTTHRFSASKMIGGPPGLSALQDAFHAECGAEFNLERGEKGSRATHVPIKTFYAHAAAVEAGRANELEPVPPPPAPSWKSKLNGEYQAAKAARNAVMERNNSKIKAVNIASRQLRAMHPSQIQKQAEKYREILRLEKLSAESNKATESRLNVISYKETRVIEAEKRLKTLDTIQQAKLLDKFSKHMSPEYIGILSKRLNIALVPGKGLCDQVRRNSLAVSLLDAAQKIDAAMDGDVMSAAQQWHDRQQDAPAPRG